MNFYNLDLSYDITDENDKKIEDEIEINLNKKKIQVVGFQIGCGPRLIGTFLAFFLMIVMKLVIEWVKTLTSITIVIMSTLTMKT